MMTTPLWIRDANFLSVVKTKERLVELLLKYPHFKDYILDNYLGKKEPMFVPLDSANQQLIILMTLEGYLKGVFGYSVDKIITEVTFEKYYDEKTF